MTTSTSPASLPDNLGGTLTFTKIKGIRIRADAANPGDLLIGPAAANGFSRRSTPPPTGSAARRAAMSTWSTLGRRLGGRRRHRRPPARHELAAAADRRPTRSRSSAPK
jgi:hypothetical protein